MCPRSRMPARGSHKARVLALLNAARPRIVSTEALIDAMYFDHVDGGAATAVKRLHVLIVHLRRRLPPGAIVNHYGIGYALAPGADVAALIPADAAQAMRAWLADRPHVN